MRRGQVKKAAAIADRISNRSGLFLTTYSNVKLIRKTGFSLSPQM